MFERRERLRLQAERAKARWADRMKNLRINSTNLMVDQSAKDLIAGASSWKTRPVVFKTATEIQIELGANGGSGGSQPEAGNQGGAGGQPAQQEQTDEVKLIQAPAADFKKAHEGKMCTQYNQLSITSDSAETCSELVKANGTCKSGQGLFFWGEVNVNHKECACCMGVNGDGLTEEQMRESPHFDVYKLD